MARTAGAVYSDKYQRWQPTIDGRPQWVQDKAAKESEAAALAWAEKSIAKLNHEDEIWPTLRAIVSAYPTTRAVMDAGYRLSTGQPVEVGDEVVLFGQTRWRRAIVVKVTPARVYAEFTTPKGAARSWPSVVGGVALRVSSGDKFSDLYLRPR